MQKVVGSNPISRSSEKAPLRRGFLVWEVSEIHEVRAALEGMAAYLACERGSDEDIARIVAFHKRQDRERLTMPASTGAPRSAPVPLHTNQHANVGA